MVERATNQSQPQIQGELKRQSQVAIAEQSSFTGINNLRNLQTVKSALCKNNLADPALEVNYSSMECIARK